MCLFPRLIKNPKYKPNKKNGGLVPPIYDKRVMAVPIGCGKCIECKKKKSREWNVRLNEDIRTNRNGKFITLTFSNESIKELDAEIREEIKGYDRDNAIATLAVRRFLERWRRKYKKSVRHWLVTELGGNGTENIHLHGIIWTDEIKSIGERWQYGFIKVGNAKIDSKGKRMDKNDTGYIGEKSISYMTKYVLKMDVKHKEYNSIILCSKGIGKEYINRMDCKKNKYEKGKTDESYTTRTGTKLALPIYYRNKIYNDEEREKLWCEKLDKEERWILGIKIDTSNNNKRYLKVLKTAREKNKRLGYGNNEKNWNIKRYENERRELLLNKRIKKIEEIKEEKIIMGNWKDAF